MHIDFVYLASLFFVNFLVGVSSFPVTSVIFGKLSDKGYTISHIIGWFVISYVHFLLVTIKVLPMNLLGILIVWLIWGSINFAVYKKYPKFKLTRPLLVKIARINIGFVLLIIFWWWVRGHNPEIYQIERFMDFGILQSLTNANSLPLFDFWYGGDTLNYYYFGHYLGYIILSLSFIPTVPGFIILIIWIYSTVGVNVYRFGHDLFIYFNSVISSKKQNKSLNGFMSGILAVFFTLFAGPFQSWYWLGNLLRVWLETFMNQNPQLGSLIPFLGGLVNTLPKEAYWYANATRFISNTITEMPLYGFLVADLHPHNWGLLVGVIAITLLFVIWKDKSKRLNLDNQYMYLVPFILALAFMINSWDVITIGMLLVGGIIIKYRRVIFKDGLESILLLISFPIFSFTLVLPWMTFFKVPSAGEGLPFAYVKESSNFVEWFNYWGSFLLLMCAYLILIRKYIYKVIIESINYIKLIFNQIFTESNKSNFIKYDKYKNISTHSFVLFVLMIVIFFWILVEIVYFTDILKDGDWYRANTVFKIANQLWLWLSMIFGGVVIYMINRFKFDLKGKVALGFISAIVIFMAMYPSKTIHQVNYMRDFTGVSTGLDWWYKRNPQQYDAYLFLDTIRLSLPRNDRVRGILEAEGQSFEDYNFFSTFLGWPTPLGWYGHEWTWQGTDEFIAKRKKEVSDAYTDDNYIGTRDFLTKYKINYIIIGPQEKEKYGSNLNKEKLESFGRIVFHNDEVEIIETELNFYD